MLIVLAALILCSCQVVMTNAGIALSTAKANAVVEANVGKVEDGYEVSFETSTRLFKFKPYISIRTGVLNNNNIPELPQDPLPLPFAAK